jgi:mannosyltransferase OCH1-like enzyme
MRKRELCKYYADTQKICAHIIDKEESELKDDERDHYQNEKIYVKENRTIPKIVHQIWFGKEPPAWRKFMFNEVERMCKKNGYEYKLWTMKDFNEKTIPITWDHIGEALEIGEDQAHNRWAQVADLARLDLVYKYGGIYMDSLFQVKDKFFKEMDKLIAKHEFIACNEEPVGLKEKWISNGFFASYPKSNILNNILVRESLNTIDLKKQIITQTTGPWYFRKAFNNIGKTKVHIIKPELIYPFLTHKDTVKRKQESNKCLTKYDASIKDKLIEINKKNDMYMYKPQYCAEMYKNSWVIYHSGLGGTWSY